MNRWERITHFKWTLILLGAGVGMQIGDWIMFREFNFFLLFLFCIVVPAQPFTREIRNYDFHNAMESRGADWRAVK